MCTLTAIHILLPKKITKQYLFYPSDVRLNHSLVFTGGMYQQNINQQNWLLKNPTFPFSSSKLKSDASSECQHTYVKSCVISLPLAAAAAKVCDSPLCALRGNWKIFAAFSIVREQTLDFDTHTRRSGCHLIVNFK
jgi:hypothetical protein